MKLQWKREKDVQQGLAEQDKEEHTTSKEGQWWLNQGGRGASGLALSTGKIREMGLKLCIGKQLFAKCSENK